MKGRSIDKRKLLIIAGIVIACLGIWGTIQMIRKHSAPQAAVTGKQQTTVNVLTVSHTNLIKRITLSGQTVPEAQVDIAAKYQGRVTAVYADLGQQVAAGETLIVQDTGDADISVKQNKAAYQQASADAVTNEVSFKSNYDKAQADYQRAKTDYERYKTLYNIGAVSKEQLDTDEQQLADAKAALDTLANQMNTSSVPSAIESARAAAQKSEQNVNAAQKQRDDLVLRAARSGIIGFRQVEVGNMVQAGQKLLSIVDNSHIYVDCQVSEQDLSALTQGMNVDIQIQSLSQTYPGRIIYISPANDSQSQTFSLRIALTNPGSEVRSGMFARTAINAILRPNVLVVPKDAVLEKNGNYFVYVVDSKNAVEERAVQIGAKGDDSVEILNGLTEGEQIAVSNLARLRSGITVIPNLASQDNRGEDK